MKNYKESDYALNRYSKGIVYRFADSIVEVTLEDFLHANPGRTEADFAELKAVSDEIYYEQDRNGQRTSCRNVSINGMEETVSPTSRPVDEELIEKYEEERVLEAAWGLLHSGELTEVQKRRFILHFFEGLSYRQIAAYEGVFFTSVAESVGSAVRKLQKFYKKI